MCRSATDGITAHAIARAQSHTEVVALLEAPTHRKTRERPEAGEAAEAAAARCAFECPACQAGQGEPPLPDDTEPGAEISLSVLSSA